MKNYKDIPLLLLVFNRPDTTKILVNKLRKIKPKNIFISQDWPRNIEDLKQILEVRKIFNLIDWDCKIKYLYRDKNLWCYNAVVWWIDWFFENIDFWIILEDDCIPNNSVFEFCYKINDIYKDNSKIWLISLSNYLTESKIKEDFLFTKHNPLLWWWATWKDRWIFFKQNNDIRKKLKSWNLKIDEKWFFKKKSIITYMNWWFWDSDLYMVCYFNNLKTIVPKYNLISNIWYIWEHNSRPWKYHNLKSIEINFDNIKKIDIIQNNDYNNEMINFIRKMYIYWEVEKFLIKIWIYKIVKYIIIKISKIIYKKKINVI